MNFFISDAYAQAAEQGDPLISMLPLVVLFVVFYFLLIRPQMKRQKAHKKLVAAIAKGDEAVTSSGMAGKVMEVGENFLDLEVADNTVIKVRREAIESILPKGSLKTM